MMVNVASYPSRSLQLHNITGDPAYHGARYLYNFSGHTAVDRRRSADCQPIAFDIAIDHTINLYIAVRFQITRNSKIDANN